MGQRGLLVCAVLFLLAACGFSPIYGSRDGKGAPTTDALSQVFIENIPDENGQKLRNKLMDRMYYGGRPAAPKEILSVALTSTEVDLGIQKDATSMLRELTLRATYTLVNKEDAGTLLSGAASSIVLYSKLDAQYGTLAAQRNAYDRAINEVAEQILGRLSLFYAETPPKASPQATEEKQGPQKSWSLGRARP